MTEQALKLRLHLVLLLLQIFNTALGSLYLLPLLQSNDLPLPGIALALKLLLKGNEIQALQIPDPQRLAAAAVLANGNACHDVKGFHEGLQLGLVQLKTSD
ncbi:MAG: hypothetical protein FRX49_03080 [Trebouxia sp. A1-2]|nr:MAG: hypothetical protein FRX49_03080 [Trebouxia sp. A1-2]